MRLIIVGAGAAGLALARSLRRRGFAPLVLDRGARGAWVPRPFMPPYQGFEALRDAGVFDAIRAESWEIAPREGAEPVALSAPFVRVMEILAEGVPVRHGVEVTGLLRDGDRVAACARAGRAARRRSRPPSWWRATASARPCAGWPASPPGSTCWRAHTSRSSPVRASTEASPSTTRPTGARSACWAGRRARRAGGTSTARRPRRSARRASTPSVRAFARLIPAAEPALAALTSVDQLVYREVTEVRAERWWVPGLVVIGDAAHAVGPEAGLGAGLGLGDAHALAIAVERSGGDPDRACADYEAWRRPAVNPYLAIGAAGARIVRGGERPSWENWPPAAPARGGSPTAAGRG